jgi:Flp pilus assembly CpaF family ATPase
MAVMGEAEEDQAARATFDALFRMNRLQRLLDDPGIENINANGCDVVWVRYATGRREQVAPVANSDTELEEMLRTPAARVGIGERRFDRGSPRLSLQLPDGSRLFALMAVAARPCMSIRRHRYLKVTPRRPGRHRHPGRRAPRAPQGAHGGEEVVRDLRGHRGGQDHAAACDGS